MPKNVIYSYSTRHLIQTFLCSYTKSSLLVLQKHLLFHYPYHKIFGKGYGKTPFAKRFFFRKNFP